MLSIEQKIYLALLLLFLVWAVPAINNRLIEHDVYTCSNYKSPQQPAWCADFLKEYAE